jgi:adenylate cyclase
VALKGADSVARNAEIKARVRDYAAFLERASALSDGPGATLQQEDTFYRTESGRLKLRKVDGAGELIYYHRPDTAGASECDYDVARVDYETTARVLGGALAVRGTVRKQRRLFMHGRTRIHVDRVEGLGDFAELEVILAPGESGEDGRAVAEGLMARLGIRAEDLVDCAYIDLIERRGSP